jgi:hypothetical protein
MAFLHAVAQRDKAEHYRECHERKDNHCDGRHVSSYEWLHAATKSTITIAANNHPATDHGHTGALMCGLSRSIHPA